MERIQLYLTDIRQLKPYEQVALNLLTPERRAEAERIKPEQERLHCIAAGLLLRHVLGVTADSQLRRNEYGRPELAGEGDCFNLSHGGNWVVLAVCSAPVGVDIEPIGEKLPIAIPRRFLQPDELAWLEEDTTPERFAWLWTRLESVLKADGRGFGLEQRNFSVLDSGKPWYLHTFPHNGHVVSCAAGEPFEVELETLQVADLLNGKLP